MFESLGLEHEVAKADFKAEEPVLRGELIDAQFDLLEAGEAPVIVLLGGMDPLGRSAAARQLMSWMDSRHIRPYGTFAPSDEEADRPRMWRFWRALPRKGRIGIFLSTWYEAPLRDYILGRIKRAKFRDRIDEILRFERMLADEGALFLKFMLLASNNQDLQDIKRRFRRMKHPKKRAAPSRGNCPMWMSRPARRSSSGTISAWRSWRSL